MRIIESVTTKRSEFRVSYPEKVRFPVSKGSAVLLHGLNNRPEALHEIAAKLREGGFTTIQLTLPGHGDHQILSAPLRQWVDSSHEALLQGIIHQGTGELLVVGYSLGGLLALLALQENPSITPTRMVLIAPALTLNIPRFILTLGRIPIVKHIRIPSMTPNEDRRWCSIPAEWYGELDKGLDKIDYSTIAKREFATSVIVSSEDEVVSASALKDLIAAEGLAKTWKYTELSPNSLNADSYQHHIINRKTLGVSGWKNLEELLLASN